MGCVDDVCLDEGVKWTYRNLIYLSVVGEAVQLDVCLQRDIVGDYGHRHLSIPIDIWQ
jgi:hypothetical protein